MNRLPFYDAERGGYKESDLECWQEASGRVELLLRQGQTGAGLVDIVNRGTRASLTSRKLSTPEDIHSLSTNCLGAFLHLQNNLSQYGVQTSPAIVLRFPWQTAQSRREIHLVGMVADEDGDIIIADPTPSAGYSYGTTRVGHRPNPERSHVSYDDEVLGDSTDYKLLTTEELSAIMGVYEYEVALDKENYDEQALRGALLALEDVPGYKARLLHLLMQQVGGDHYQETLNQMSPFMMRRSYAHYLRAGHRGTVMDIYQLESEREQSLLGNVEQAIEASLSVSEYSYFSSLRNQFDPLRVPDAMDFSYLNPKYFSNLGSREPIRDYELFISEHAPHLAVSNLYTTEW